MELVRTEHLEKRFPTGRSGSKEERTALENVSLSIREGQLYGIVGESGCGKSTLARCILRLTDASAGKVFFRGENLTHLKPAEMQKYRRQMQMVFQNPYASFNPKFTIGASIREVGTVHQLTDTETETRLARLMEAVKLEERVLNRFPGELSGGQLQRLAIARALLLEPSFLVADEPVSALDVSVQAQILNLILELRERLGLTLLFISHDLTVVEQICDFVTVLYLGTVVESAPVSRLFGDIRHPYTKALVAAKPREDPDQPRQPVLLKSDITAVSGAVTGCRFAARCERFQPGICDRQAPVLKEVSCGHFVACHFAENRYL